MVWTNEDMSKLHGNEEKTIAFLNDLPSDTDTRYTKELIRLVVNNPPDIKDILYNIVKKHINDSGDLLAFSAFYGLVVYFRRYKIFSELEKIVAAYGNYFRNKPLFDVAMCTIYRNKGSKLDLQLALEYATRAVEKCNNHQGILQTYADTVAYTMEQGYDVSDQILAKAIHCVNEAIMIDDKYPKYYCTIGRLLIYKGEYTQAQNYILKAIDLEDSKQTDYAIRIADYQNYLQRCYTRESVSKINISVENALSQITETKSKVEEQIEKEKITYLEFLGFFTAIISFILGTIQLASNFEFIEATGLIIMLLGVIIVAMCVLLLLTGIKKTSNRMNCFLILFGIGCLIIGVILPYIFDLLI